MQNSCKKAAPVTETTVRDTGLVPTDSRQLLLMNTFSALSFDKSAIDLSNVNPARGHKEVRRSTDHIMVTTRYSDQQVSKSRQNLCQVQPIEKIGNLSASRRGLWIRATVSTLWRAANTSYSCREDCLMYCPSNKVIKSDPESFLALGVLHGDKLCDTLRAMAPANVKTVIKPPYSMSRATSIDSNCCRLPTTSVLSNKAANHAPISFDQQDQFLKATHRTENREIEIPRSMVVRPRADEAGTRADIQPSKALCIPEKALRTLTVRRSLLALIGRKQIVVKHQLFSQKPPGSRLIFWSRDVGSAVPPRDAPPIFRSRIRVNTIGTQLRDPINSVLARWRMAV